MYIIHCNCFIQLQHGVKLLSNILLQAIEKETNLVLEDVYRIWNLAQLLGKGMCIEGLEIVAMNYLAKNFVKFSQVDGFNTDVSCEFLEKCLVRNNLALNAMEDRAADVHVAQDKFKERTIREDKVCTCLLLSMWPLVSLLL